MTLAVKTPLTIFLLFISFPSRQSEAFSMSKNGPFALNVAFKVKPDRRDEFLSVMKKDVKQTLTTEPNAQQFLLGQDVDDPNVFYLHEEYKSMTDHRETHSNTKHYDDCMEFFSTEPFSEPLTCDEFILAHDGPADKVSNRKAVCLNVELNIKPDRRLEFLKVIENNKQGSDQEPACLQYSWGENIEKPNTFHFHEQYIGEEGVEAHNAAPHFKVWEDFANTDPFAKPPLVQKFNALVE